MKLRTLLATTAIVSALAAATDGHAQVATINPVQSSLTGLDLNTGMSNATSQTAFANDGSTLLILRNWGTAVTATIPTVAQSISQAGYGTVSLTDITLSIPTSRTVVVGPFPTGRWNSAVYGTVLVSISTPANVSVTALKTAQ